MKCTIIDDLLPLYAEDMVSADSRAMIEEHIAACPECAAKLKKLKERAEIPVDRDAAPIARAGRAVRRKRAASVVLAAALILAAAATVIAWMTVPRYIPYEDVEVYAEDTGSGVKVSFVGGMIGVETLYYDLDSGDGRVGCYSAYGTLWDEWTGRLSESMTYCLLSQDVVSVEYSGRDGTDNVLVWGEDPTPSGGTRILPDLFLTYYFYLALIGVVVCLLLTLLFRARVRVKRVFLCLTMAAASYLVAICAVSGFTFVTYSGYHGFLFSAVTALFLFAACLSGEYLITRAK